MPKFNKAIKNTAKEMEEKKAMLLDAREMEEKRTAFIDAKEIEEKRRMFFGAEETEAPTKSPVDLSDADENRTAAKPSKAQEMRVTVVMDISLHKLLKRIAVQQERSMQFILRKTTAKSLKALAKESKLT